MAKYPPDSRVNVLDEDVIAAIYAGVTTVIRRVEIYKYDGVTLWDDGTRSRVVDGGVAISASSDSRRVLDLTFVNDDNSIVYDPEGNGLWYDKIIKVYRGVQYKNTRVTPKIAILVDGSTVTKSPAEQYLTQAGLTDITYIQNPTLDTMTKYDVIVGVAWTADFSANVSLWMQQAYGAGLNVFSFGPMATSATVPLILTTGIYTQASSQVFVPPLQDSPLGNSVPSFSSYHQINDTYILTYRSTTFPAARTSGGNRYPAVYEMNVQGGRWVHFNFRISNNDTPRDRINEIRMITGMFRWLYTYHDTRWWEVQLGEFMIDNIEETDGPPHTLKISGRDYSKKLDLCKFVDPLIFQTGTSVDDVLLALLNLAGIKKFIVKSGAGTLTANFQVQSEQSALDAIKNLSSGYVFEWFFDNNGFFIARQYRDPSTSNATSYLRTGGVDGNLIGFTRTSSDENLKNHVIVISDKGKTTYRGEAKNTNPSSPTRIARLNDRLSIIRNSLPDSDAACQKLAERILAVSGLETYSVNFTSLVFPWLEVNEIQDFTDPRYPAEYPKRYLLTDLSIPLGLGGMTGTSKRIVVVS